jgi:hypothetical protein
MATIVATRKAAAEACGVSVTAFANWKKEHGFPVRKDGKYCIESILKWHQATHRQRKEDDTEGAIDEGKRDKKLRNDEREEKLALLRIRKATQLGRLLPRDLVRELIAIIAGRVRASTKTMQRSGYLIPARLVSEQLDIAEQEINAAIDRAMRDAES